MGTPATIQLTEPRAIQRVRAFARRHGYTSMARAAAAMLLEHRDEPGGEPLGGKMPESGGVVHSDSGPDRNGCEPVTPERPANGTAAGRRARRKKGARP